jgi:hypothetical protein
MPTMFGSCLRVCMGGGGEGEEEGVKGTHALWP